MSPDDDRNAAILRRTLSAISWLYALWSGLLGTMAMALRRSAEEKRETDNDGLAALHPSPRTRSRIAPCAAAHARSRLLHQDTPPNVLACDRD